MHVYKKRQTRKAIIEQLQRDFNLAPLVAETLHAQMSGYFAEHYERQTKSGQMTYVAVAAEEPAGRKLEECQRIPVTLTLYEPDDLLALREGVAS